MNGIRKINQLSLMNKNVLFNMLGAFAVKGVSLIISVLLMPAYIHFFEDNNVLGVWYTLLSTMTWMSFFDLGLGHGLRNKLTIAIEKKDRKSMKEYISTTYYVMLLIAVLVCILGVAIIYFIDWNVVFNVKNDMLSSEVLRECVIIVFVGIMISLVLKIITSILYSLQHSALVNLIIFFSNVIILIAILIIKPQGIETNLRIVSYVNVIAINLPYIICTIVVFISVLKDCKPSFSYFRKSRIKEIMGISIALMWLSIIFMVVSSTNEILITNLTGPENVVEYQAYYKIFNTGAMLISLALTPIWSAVTKAQAQKNFMWIQKVYKVFLVATLGCFLLELCIVPFLQFIVDIWLQENAIMTRVDYSIAFAIFGTIFILHNVNTSIGNGMSYFKLQMIWMTVAAVVFIPLASILVNVMGSWIGIIWSAIISLLPYEILAPIYTIRLLKNKTVKCEEKQYE